MLSRCTTASAVAIFFVLVAHAGATLIDFENMDTGLYGFVCFKERVSIGSGSEPETVSIAIEEFEDNNKALRFFPSASIGRLVGHFARPVDNFSLEFLEMGSPIAGIDLLDVEGLNIGGWTTNRVGIVNLFPKLPGPIWGFTIKTFWEEVTIDNLNITFSEQEPPTEVPITPEPSTYLLFAVGILAIIGMGYRQHKKR